MMKKLLSTLLALCLLLTSLGMVTASAEDVVAYDGSEVTIKFYHTMGSNLTTVLDAMKRSTNTIPVKVLESLGVDYSYDFVTRRLGLSSLVDDYELNGINYSTFMHGLKLAGVEMNRKMLSETAIHEPAAFAALVETAKAALAK